ncbi:hypothetical protein [Mycobacterium decipiens]|uniref:hypothetical protein n=1 Tax=Mycobacterium decipiens TaxID=1430326 RepID=UPI001055ACC9|nr:hypothetical protein [Mycobacterium decipiens]
MSELRYRAVLEALDAAVIAWPHPALSRRARPASDANPRTGYASTVTTKRIRIDTQAIFNDGAIETPLAA